MSKRWIELLLHSMVQSGFAFCVLEVHVSAFARQEHDFNKCKETVLPFSNYP